MWVKQLRCHRADARDAEVASVHHEAEDNCQRQQDNSRGETLRITQREQ